MTRWLLVRDLRIGCRLGMWFISFRDGLNKPASMRWPESETEFPCPRFTLKPWLIFTEWLNRNP